MPIKRNNWQTRDILNYNDLEQRPRKFIVLHHLIRQREQKYSNLDYRDVSHSNFKSNRSTNPLNPVYQLSYLDGEKVTHGKIEYSFPTSTYPFIYN